jgi:uncharacterized membrane protein SpoIIM required for sporulation
LHGSELDELVDLYQRAATHLSVVRTRSPDPVLVDRLSQLVTRARAAVAGARDPSWREVGRFLTVTFPAGVWIRRWWIAGAAAGFLLVAIALGVWLAHDPGLQSALVPAQRVRTLCDSEFADYYRSAPASSFAAKVWTNNAWVAAGCIALGALLGLPTVLLLLDNALNAGVDGGYLASCGQSSQFFTLILPHGMLELTAVFVAAGAGLRLGWRLVEPGPRRRVEALAQEGRAAVGLAIGLVLVLAISGAIEAFVTPSGLPAWARLAIGAAAEAGFLAYVAVLGRRAVLAEGVHVDDLSADLAGDLVPVA